MRKTDRDDLAKSNDVNLEPGDSLEVRLPLISRDDSADSTCAEFFRITFGNCPRFFSAIAQKMIVLGILCYSTNLAAIALGNCVLSKASTMDVMHPSLIGSAAIDGFVGTVSTLYTFWSIAKNGEQNEQSHLSANLPLELITLIVLNTFAGGPLGNKITGSREVHEDALMEVAIVGTALICGIIAVLYGLGLCFKKACGHSSDEGYTFETHLRNN